MTTVVISLILSVALTVLALMFIVGALEGTRSGAVLLGGYTLVSAIMFGLFAAPICFNEHGRVSVLSETVSVSQLSVLGMVVLMSAGLWSLAGLVVVGRVVFGPLENSR